MRLALEPAEPRREFGGLVNVDAGHLGAADLEDQRLFDREPAIRVNVSGFDDVSRSFLDMCFLCKCCGNRAWRAHPARQLACNAVTNAARSSSVFISYSPRR